MTASLSIEGGLCAGCGRAVGSVAEPAPARSGYQVEAAAELSGSVQIRHVDAGSCNGCEVEIGSAFGPVYDA